VSSSQTSGAATRDSHDIIGAQRELLGHQLARDQRSIGGERDDDRKADGQRGFGVETQQRLQPLAHRPPQARARIGAREDADQRDAHLHRRQEAAGIGGELARDLRAAAAALFRRLQARIAGRNDREFGHGENAVEQDQDRDDRDVRPGKGGHRAALMIIGRRGGARSLSASVMKPL
jgi:hypothetical protein